jgi:hypothetical protein
VIEEVCLPYIRDVGGMGSIDEDVVVGDAKLVVGVVRIRQVEHNIGGDGWDWCMRVSCETGTYAVSNVIEIVEGNEIRCGSGGEVFLFDFEGVCKAVGGDMAEVL